MGLEAPDLVKKIIESNDWYEILVQIIGDQNNKVMLLKSIKYGHFYH